MEILLGLLAGLGALFDSGKLMTPVALECAGPIMERLNGIGVGVVKHLAALASHFHKTNFQQHAKVLGDGRLRQVECGDNVVYCALLGDEEGEDVAAAGFGHGIEGVGSGGGTGHG
jgi:hypothetical protein